jgi:hypothetical protein
MKKLMFIWVLVHLLACSKSSSISNSNSGGGTITMKTASGVSYSSSNITRVLQTTTGVFFFNADPFDSYRKFYFFSGSFDVHNSLTLDITLDGTNSIIITGSRLLSDVKINDNYPIIAKEVVNLTSNVYPGKIAGSYTFYDNKNAVICSGTFDYNAK